MVNNRKICARSALSWRRERGVEDCKIRRKVFNLCKPARSVDKLDLSISLLNQKTDGGKVTKSLICLGAFFGWNGLGTCNSSVT